MPIRNFTSDEGRALGAKMAQWCDDAEPVARLIVPDLTPRCASCAFRPGPHLASGSPATQMDALKCVMERTPFGCHDVHRPDEPCSGWLMMMLGNSGDEPVKAPWDFVGGDDNRPRSDRPEQSGPEGNGAGPTGASPTNSQ